MMVDVSDDYDRENAVFAPRRWSALAAAGDTLPIVLAFHGGNGTVAEFIITCRLQKISVGTMQTQPGARRRPLPLFLRTACQA